MSSMIVCPRLITKNLPNESVQHIHCGEYILLHNGEEFFWAEVADVRGRGYIDAIVKSKVQTSSYSFDSLIRCHQRHIFLRGSEDQRVSNTHENRQA